MEWMKSLVSPRARRKKLQLSTGNNSILTATPRIFGVTLDELMTRAPDNATVPLVVSRICEYLYKFGLASLDLIRVSDNVRMIERMRLQFEHMGDVNLEEVHDVAATAGLLRVFLLNLPDTLIPGRLTLNFFSVVQDPQLNEEAIVHGIKTALNLLPLENYNVLKYISSLLAVLADNELDNEMSATSLAIVFGPCIFRCDLALGLDGLRNMDYSKDITHLFISEYGLLFLEESDPSPQEFWAQCLRKRSSPLRFSVPKVRSMPSFTSAWVKSTTNTLTSSASSSSLYHHRVSSSYKVDEILKDLLQSWNSVDRKEMLSGGNKNKENDECSSDKYEEDRESSSPTNFKAKPFYINDNRTLSLQSASLHSSLEHSSSQPSPFSSSVSSMLDRSPSNGMKLFIPPLDLSTLHEHVDGEDPIPMSQEQSDTFLWIKTSHLTGAEEAAILSPRSYNVKGLSDCDEMVTAEPFVFEAPMSPSAYYDSGPFRAPLNTDIPPSPLMQQDVYKKHSDDDCNYRLRQLTMKIQGLKKKIKSFEESFERDHGYKPSHGEKSAQPEIKKYISELSKAKKNLDRLKEDTEKGNRSRHSSGASSSGLEMSPPVTHSMEVTLEYILHCLEEKRQEAERPEEITRMSREQLLEEKVAVQRALLHFEGLHGRPTSSEERDLVRPLYDRYRSVKRMLIKPLSPCISLELQTVPEDQMIEIPLSFSRDSMKVSATHLGDDDIGALGLELVTQDMAVFGEQNLSDSQDKFMQQADRGVIDDSSSEDAGIDSQLHQMSLAELHVEIELSKGHKKRLRRVLREFEMDFFHQNYRKVQKEDRYPLHTEYSEYKKVKARLRLLEALILKHCE